MSIKGRFITVVGAMLAITLALIVARHSQMEGTLRVAMDGEFLVRPDGFPALCKHYGLEFKAPPIQMDPGLMYRALDDKAVDLVDVFATDGRITKYDIFVLEDDKDFFPPYAAAPLVRAAVMEKYPRIGELLRQFGGKLPDREMRKLNFASDSEGRKPEDIARTYLLNEGLLYEEDDTGDGSAGTITIASKSFNENELLGWMFAELIERKTDIRVVRKFNLGGTMIVFNALRTGDIDIYPEYTGTALVNILKEPPITDRERTYRTVRRMLKERYDLAMLPSFAFNNTYALGMRREHAERLGISTISDLAAYLRRNRDRD